MARTPGCVVWLVLLGAFGCTRSNGLSGPAGNRGDSGVADMAAGSGDGDGGIANGDLSGSGGYGDGWSGGGDGWSGDTDGAAATDLEGADLARSEPDLLGVDLFGVDLAHVTPGICTTQPDSHACDVCLAGAPGNALCAAGPCQTQSAALLLCTVQGKCCGAGGCDNNCIYTHCDTQVIDLRMCVKTKCPDVLAHCL
jgi:hypothetical protein